MPFTKLEETLALKFKIFSIPFFSLFSWTLHIYETFWYYSTCPWYCLLIFLGGGILFFRLDNFFNLTSSSLNFLFLHFAVKAIQWIFHLVYFSVLKFQFCSLIWFMLLFGVFSWNFLFLFFANLFSYAFLNMLLKPNSNIWVTSVLVSLIVFFS